MLSPASPDPSRRLVVIWALFSVFILVLLGRLLYWQVLRQPELVQLGQEEHYLTRTIYPQRGAILDRQGWPLALNLYGYDIFASPREITEPLEVAQSLSMILDVSPGDLLSLLSIEGPGVTLARGISLDAGEKILSLGLPGVETVPLPRRSYPEGTLAAHVLGFVNIDGLGNYGVEGWYNHLLKGEPGSRGGEEDPQGLEVIAGYGSYVPPQDGATLILTIDRTVQHFVEQALEQALQDSGADSGTIIVMDPQTGAILAMASRPTYDPNQYYETDPQELFVNPAISQVFEPGSIFKIITMAAALDTGLVNTNSTYEDRGTILVGGRPIYNWDYSARGTMTMTELLKYSLNVGAATLSTRLGAEKFYEYIHRFGFGELSGVDLAGEIPGLVKVPGDSLWYESDLGTNSFGQGIGVTPLQMITAVATVANGGYLVQPYLVQKIVSTEGETLFQPVIRRQVISPKTAQDLTQMLVSAVPGETSLAAIPGYTIAGKTGTAQIPIPGGYDPVWTLASFVGFAPAEDPQFVIIIKLDRPTASPWGSVVAAPVFRNIARELFDYLGIPPDEVRLAGRD
ncbi:MAG: penicillin-binding protein 2 [Chloroflexi bacterium]|nr:penicillin-binding protein 2 [Chloroflexota bacterium]